MYAISRTPSKLDALAKKYPSIIPILCDLTKWSEAENILTEKLPADLDILINNAGMAKSETITELTEEGVDGYKARIKPTEIYMHIPCMHFFNMI